MGGNALHHLMPEPFFAHRYVVAKARAHEESIQDMIDACKDVATADNRFKIEVMPGEYVEEITMEPYCDVVAPYGRAIIRPASVTTAAITMASNCMLQGLMVDMQTIAGTGKTGIAIGANTNCYLEDVWVTGGGATDIGISDASTGTTVIIRRCRIDGAATGYKKTGTGTTWFYDNRVTSSLAIRSVQGAVADDGGAQTDQTTEANDDTPNDMDLFPQLPDVPAVGDAYYFGGAWLFQQLSLNIGTAGVKGPGSWTIVWEYYDRETAGWVSLAAYGITDNTSEFTVAGTSTVTFTPPTTWASSDVAGITAYWIRARISAVATPIGTAPLGTQAWVTDSIDIDVDGGTLNLIENELMYEGTGANVDVAAAAITINAYGNTLAGDGWRIGDDATAKVYSHNDNFQKVNHAGAGFMIAKEEPRTYLVHDGMKIGDGITDIAAIGDASDTNRYLIRVFTGEYAEAVTMAQYVDLIGESNQSVVISQATGAVITCAANSKIKSVRVELTAASGGDDGIYANNIAAYIEDVVVVVTNAAGGNFGICAEGTGGFEIHDSIVTCDNVSDYPIYANGSGTQVIYDSELINTDTAGYGILVGSAVTLSSFNNKLRSDEGFDLVSHANTVVLSYGDDFTSVNWSGITGLFADLTGCRLYACASGLEIGEWVYVSADDTVALSDSDDLTKMPSIGVINYKPTTTTCYVKQYGYYYDANANSGHGDAFVAGDEYWISGTPGEITTTMPGVWPQMAGVAASTQRFKVIIGENLGLVHCNEYTCTAEEIVGEWVYISANDTVDEAKADAAATMNAIGVIVQKIDDTTALVKLRGKWAEATRGWTPNDKVYISEATAGVIVNTPPIMGIVQQVATVKSDDAATIIYELND